MNGTQKHRILHFFPLIIVGKIPGNSNLLLAVQGPTLNIYFVLTLVVLGLILLTFLYLQAKGRHISKQRILLQQENEQLSEQIASLQFDSETLISQKKEGLKKEVADMKTNINALDTALKAANESAVRNSVLLSNISYTLRTNLNDIMGFSSLLEHEFAQQEEEELFEYSENIRRSGQSLLHLLNNMIDISRIEAKQFDITQSSCNLPEIIKEVVSTYEPIATQKELTIAYQPEDIPAFSTDIEALQHILSNLLDNAVKYTEKGFIKISHKQENEKIYITVKDTGVGIDKAFITDIFEPFGQVQPGYSKSSFKGAGLGLPLVRQMLDLMGGEIDFQSEKAMGTIVTVILPFISPQKKKESVSVSAETKLEKPVPKLNKPLNKILIIDGDVLNKMLIRKMIPDISEIQQVAKEKDLATLLENEAGSKPVWDVILLDNDFEQLDYGISLMQHYTERFPYIKDIPFVSMLSVPDKTTERKCLSEGFSGCIDKPITKENLIAILNKILPGN